MNTQGYNCKLNSLKGDYISSHIICCGRFWKTLGTLGDVYLAYDVHGRSFWVASSGTWCRCHCC